MNKLFKFAVTAIFTSVALSSFAADKVPLVIINNWTPTNIEFYFNVEINSKEWVSYIYIDQGSQGTPDWSTNSPQTFEFLSGYISALYAKTGSSCQFQQDQFALNTQYVISVRIKGNEFGNETYCTITSQPLTSSSRDGRS